MSVKSGTEAFQRRGVATVTLVVIAALVACLLFGKNFQTGNDPRGTLLVSQAIIEHGTIRLDQYQVHFRDYTYRIHERNGHFYYYFPLGTSFVSIPFVAAAKLFGADMAMESQQTNTQLIIAAVALLLSFLVMQRIARLYLDPLPSAVLSAAFLFGTSFLSTGMKALWSHDFAALFALLAIHTLLRAKKSSGRPGNWQFMAVCLFIAYLCRPTLLLLAPIVVAIQFIYVDRKSALKLVGALLLLAATFVAFSWHEFHQVLPDYYLPNRLSGGDFWLALYGNLASPARGLFVYSPFLLLPVLTVPYLWQKYPAYRAELSLALWPVLHLLAISNFPSWWAGYSYGARLMYDALPGLFVVFIIFWRGIDKRSLTARFTMIATAFAVVVNFGQGIFNPYATMWNATTNPNQHPEFIFNWRYPQFLQNAARHQQLVAEMPAFNLNAAKSKLHESREKVGNENIELLMTDHRVRLGEQYGFTSKALGFLNWGVPESKSRWSEGYYSEIVFMPDATALSSTAIRMELDSITPQNIRVLVNDTDTGTLQIFPGGASVKIDIRNMLKPNEVNALQFELPEATRASNNDARILSIALKSITFTRD